MNDASNHLIDLISPCIKQLGYRIIFLEAQNHRQKTLRIYIDHLDSSIEKLIGIEDCVKVSKALEEPLDQLSEVEALFHGPYELEVSSPGVDRPLRTAEDFQRFSGSQVRIHLFRPLTSEEVNNPDYLKKNPKQKNFLGTLAGFREDQIHLWVNRDQGFRKEAKKSEKKQSAAEKSSLATNSVEGNQITIPFRLISKANLEPDFSFEGRDEDERE